jgi:arylformamidase
MIQEQHTLIDISPTLHEETAVWPGDTPFSRKINLAIGRGHNMDLSHITTTLHIGTHADAPSHYSADGLSIEDVPLHPYFGLCQVITIRKGPRQRIMPEDISVEIQAPRVLFRTLSFPDPNHFTKDFNSFSKELITFLANKKVCLVGIDTPSVDPFDDKILETHNALLENRMYNIEGLVLNTVKDGLYTLSAFPLKIEGADAAPLRAILIENYSPPETKA